MFNTDECDRCQRTGAGRGRVSPRASYRLASPAEAHEGLLLLVFVVLTAVRLHLPRELCEVDMRTGLHLRLITHFTKCVIDKSDSNNRQDEPREKKDDCLGERAIRGSSQMRCRRKDRFGERDSPESTS